MEINVRKFILLSTIIGLFFSAIANAEKTPEDILGTKMLFTIEHSFSQPSDIAVGKNKNIYVLDGVNNKVKVFNYNGKYLFSFGETGQANGLFNSPLGICTDDEDSVYIADSANQRVQVFSPSGEYLWQLKIQTDGNGSKPADPTDVVVNSNLKRCYVVDNDNHRILIYDIEKKILTKQVGIMGMEKEEFRFPFLIDINSLGQLFIVEVINTRVKVLDPEGNYLTNIGGWGVEKGEFFRPKGVAVSSDGRVFVSDSYLGVVQVFDKDGTFIYVIGDSENKVRKFITPTGLFIDDENRLYVVEMTSNRVSVFSLIVR